MAPCGWADLPVERVLEEIVRRVPCQADRSVVQNVCSNWRKAVKISQPPPAPLPCLLLTSEPTPTLSCVLSKGEIHELVTHHAPPPARYFGSCDGTWVLAALSDPLRHVAFNLSSGISIELPNRICDDAGRIKDMDIQFATFSSAPDAQSIAAGAVQSSNGQRITFWRHGDEVATILDGFNFAQWSPTTEVEDVLFFNQKFYFLTAGEELRVCAPAFGVDGVLHAKLELLAFPDGCDHSPGCEPCAKYLVSSRNKILLVARYSPSSEPEKKTTSFAVFEMIEGDGWKPKEKLCNQGLVTRGGEHRWHQLPALDGRLLFVGRGCSRAYEATLYPGFKEGVFFFDEDLFNENEGQHSCDDSGKWSAAVPDIEPFFPVAAHLSSSYSCPTWVLPPAGLPSDGDKGNHQEGAHPPGVASNAMLRIEDDDGSDDEDDASDDDAQGGPE